MSTDITGQGQPSTTINGAVVQPPITEAAAATTEDPASPKFVELARRAKLQRQRELKMQADRQAFERKEFEFQTKQKEYETNYIPKDRLRTDLIGVLSEAGLNMEQIAGLVNNQPVAVELEMRALKKEIAELRSYNEQSSKSAQENQGAQYEQAVNQIRMDAKNLIGADARFETIKDLGQTEAVVELIKQTFETGMGEKYPKGTVIDIETAATLVEEQLIEDALKMANLNKVKQKQAPLAEAQAQPTANKITYSSLKANQPIRTLTNTITATPIRSSTHAEKRARAIALLEGRTP